jgi:hypothetical protein
METQVKSISKMQVRAKIQELIQDNMRPAIGRFDTKELNERGFTDDLVKYIEKLIPQK